jgi:hypothetical protein
MRTSDIALSLFILIVFVGLYAANVLAVGIQKVKKNWPLYRCNPTVMPFAGTFGHDVKSNFVYCIQNMQKDYMGHILQPLNFNLGSLTSIGGELTDAVSGLQGFVGRIRSDISGIVGKIFGVFLNMLIQIQKIIIDIKDTFGKITGIMATLLYTISGTVMTTQSMWNGPPGETVKALCFHPDTIMQLDNGVMVRMKDIEIGDVLKEGIVVEATMKIKNFDDAGEPIHNFYLMPKGENENSILVTGSHLVYDDSKSDFVRVSEHPDSSPTNMTSKTLCCLVTSDNTIPIGSYRFHDWEDNNGVATSPYSH